ncbi:MAG: DUF998 domain-containing protein [Undibacterium sp.]|nr:DUF998 domain-containing protein [Undibacterium sp.]
MFTITATVLSVIYLFVGLFALAPRKPGYSHLKHTISEIGEIGAPHQRFVAFGLFLPIGLLLLVVAYLTQSISSSSAALSLCIAIGYLVAAGFPCDPGSPLSGTFRQAIHNLGGAVEYIGGGFALMAIAERLGQPFKAAGFIVLGSAIALSFMPSTSVRGIIQRVAEVCLFGGLAFSIWRQGGVI